MVNLTTRPSLAGFLKFKGIFDANQVFGVVNACNAQLCEPALDVSEVEKIVCSINKYPNTWEEPQALPEKATIVPTMDASFLPEVLKPWICDIIERMQVPVEFIAVPAIVSISACIGRSACIRPKRFDDWSVVPNLWGALVARPGFFKSPCISEALKPLLHLTRLAHQEFLNEALLANCEEEVVKAQIDKIIDRISRGTLQVDRLCLSIIGGLQPGKLKE